MKMKMTTRIPVTTTLPIPLHNALQPRKIYMKQMDIQGVQEHHHNTGARENAVQNAGYYEAKRGILPPPKRVLQ